MTVGRKYIEENRKIQTGEKVEVNPRHQQPDGPGHSRSTSEKAIYQRGRKQGVTIRKLPKKCRGTVPQIITK